MLLSEYLKMLGDTSEKVADSLRIQGIKGVKTSTCHCPILNGIYKACPDYWTGLKIYGGDSKYSGTKAYYYARLHDDQIMDPILPQPVIDFIADFDQGKYPDLEAKSVKEVTVRVWE